jgi:hypothetical protein
LALSFDFLEFIINEKLLTKNAWQKQSPPLLYFFISNSRMFFWPYLLHAASLYHCTTDFVTPENKKNQKPGMVYGRPNTAGQEIA